MATLYYNAAVDTTWDNVSNWWQDSAYSIPALNTPQDGDTAYIDGELDSGASVATVTLADIICGTINTGAYTITLSASYNVNGDVECHNSCVLYSNVLGDVTLYDASQTASCTITGSATYNDTSQDEDSSYSANVILNNSSSGYFGIVGGNLTCYDTTSVYSGAITGTTDFYDYSVLPSSSLGITTTGAVNFYDYSSCQSPLTNTTVATFNDSSYCTSSITGDATFTNPAASDDSFNGVLGTLTVSGSAYSDFSFGNDGNTVIFLNDVVFTFNSILVSNMSGFVYNGTGLLIVNSGSGFYPISVVVPNTILNSVTFSYFGESTTITGNVMALGSSSVAYCVINGNLTLEDSALVGYGVTVSGNLIFKTNGALLATIVLALASSSTSASNVLIETPNGINGSSILGMP